jgi:hypothetical protein
MNQNAPSSATPAAIPGLARVGEDDRGAERRDRQVDPEDQPPREVDQKSTGERPDSQGDRRHGGPDPEGARLLGARKGRGDERDRERQERGGAGALDDPAADQGLLAPGDGREDRARGENAEAAQEQPPAAEHVAEPADRHHQHGDGQQVRVHDPLQPNRRGVEIPLEGREGERDDRRVQHQQEQARARPGERPPLSIPFGEVGFPGQVAVH